MYEFIKQYPVEVYTKKNPYKPRLKWTRLVKGHWRTDGGTGPIVGRGKCHCGAPHFFYRSFIEPDGTLREPKQCCERMKDGAKLQNY